jgi:precorrin-8X/cobalt-precorrin-8 methylmutase
MVDIFEPHAIEKRSMEIITKELNGRTWPEPEFSIVKRCIHTSADFDYADNLRFSDGAAKAGVAALRGGADIITDTKMAFAGINKNRLSSYGGEAHCFISDSDVIAEAKERGCTRATVCMERSVKINKPLIFAIGNAPTALVRLSEMMDDGSVRPALVIGAPVGFVNVIESKDDIMKACTKAGVPFIVPIGRKGGSNIAATVCNAMLYYNGEI